MEKIYQIIDLYQEVFEKIAQLILEKEGVDAHSEDFNKVMLQKAHSIKERTTTYVSLNVEGLNSFISHCTPELKEKLALLQREEGVELINDCVMKGIFVFTPYLKLTDKDVSELYTIANEAILKDPYLAKRYFASLIFLDFTTYEFWLGYAAACHHLGEKHEARLAYQMVLVMESSNPTVYLYYARFLTLEKDPLAKEVIKMGLEVAGRDQRFSKELSALEKLKTS